MIRTLALDDIPACETILTDLDEWFGIESSNRAYIESLRRLPAFVFTDEHRVTGFLALEPHFPGAIEVSVIAVARASRGRGIGRALMEQAEGWSNAHGYGWIHVKTRGPSTYDDDYEPTRRFYAALGYAPLYESLTEWGEANAALILVKHLGCRGS